MSAIIVLGTHRSGTSLLTRLLHLAEVYVGAAPDANYETWPVMSANEQLLATHNAHWDAPLPFARALKSDMHRMQQHVAQYFLAPRTQRQWLGDAYFQRYGRLSALPMPYAIKDPRFAFTLPVWQPLFSDVRYVRIQRHGVDVAHSLMRRQRMMMQRFGASMQEGQTLRLGCVTHTMRCTSLHAAFEVWRAYEHALNQLPVHPLTIAYEHLLHDPQQVMQRVLTHLSITPPPQYMERITPLIHPGNAYKYRHSPALLRFAARHRRHLTQQPDMHNMSL